MEGGAEEVTQKDTQTVDRTEGRVTVSGSVSLCHNSEGSTQSCTVCLPPVNISHPPMLSGDLMSSKRHVFAGLAVSFV